jgi:hypothetical protein
MIPRAKDMHREDFQPMVPSNIDWGSLEVLVDGVCVSGSIWGVRIGWDGRSAILLLLTRMLFGFEDMEQVFI